VRSSTSSDGSGQLSIEIAALQVVALVVQFLPATQSQGHFGASIGEVKIQRDQRETLLLDRPNQAPDLAAVEKQLTASHRWLYRVTP
jgi:hypothetical protein